MYASTNLLIKYQFITLEFELQSDYFREHYTVNNYRQVTGMVTGENFAFFIYRHFVEIL